MALDPLIARGYQGQIGNALQDARREQRTNTLLDLRAQSMQNELDDDAEWDQAFAAKDVATMMKIDPVATQPILQLWQSEKMAGLEDVPISREKIDMGDLQKRQLDEQKFAFDKMDSNRDFRLRSAQEARLSNQDRQPSAPPSGYRWRPDGSLAAIPGGPADTGATGQAAAIEMSGFKPIPGGVKLTEVQGKAANGASMIAEHLPTVTRLIREGYKPTKQDLFAVGPPLKGVGNTLAQEMTPRSAANPRANDFYNAGGKILTAILRPESGGAITEDEWTMYGPLYLPWPGDDDATVKRKMTSLDKYMKRLAAQSGPASQYFSGPVEEEIIDLPPRGK